MDTRLQNQAKAASTPSVSPVQAGLFQSRPFSDSEQEAAEASDSFHQPPNLPTKLEPASRFGHNFSRVQVQTNTPAAIQAQLVNRQPEEQQDEEEANGVAQPLKMMAPPIGEPIERESSEESIQMLPDWGKRTLAIQRQEEEEALQMMPQVGFLTPVIQREEYEEDPIQMMPQWGMLQRLPQEEDDLPMQMMPQWGVIQRQESEAEEEPIQMKWLQPKLVVGAPGDKYEQEADSVAAQVMSMSNPPDNSGLIQRQEEEEPESLVQRSSLVDSITPLVQRQTEEQEDAIQAKSLLQRRGKGNAEAGSDVESQLNQSKGGGSPLPDEVRSFMEPRFGTDFSSVRVHTDSTAVQMNKDLRAQAFAHGTDIYYGAGKSPGTDALTAHELTHVVQQTGAKKLQQKPILTRKENKEAVQPLTPNQELRHSPLEAKSGEIEESHNILQAKKLPHSMSAVTWYKEQQSSLLEEEEAKKPAEAKPLSGGNPEHALEGNTHLEENVKRWGDKAVAKAKPQIDFKEAKSKTELASEAAKEIKTAGKLDLTAAKTDAPPSEHQVKSASKVDTPESHHSVGAKADAGKLAGLVLPATNKEVTPESKAATSPPPQAAAQKAQTENKAKDQPATEATTAAPATASPVVAAPPALESGGETVEEATGTSDVQEEEIAAAEQAPPGSAELEPAERDAALASVAEGSGGGGEAVGGGGGGGGAAIADKPTPPAPNVSQAEPSAALSAVSNLPPAQLLGALGGVGAAVGTSVGKQRAELAANPPQMERPTGSPMTSVGPAADRSTPSGKNPKAVAKTPEGQAKPVLQPKPVALSAIPPVAKIPQPQVKGDAEGKLDAGDAQKLQASLRSLPTSDPGLQQVSACAPPHLELQGNADPQQAQQQRGELEKGIADAHSKGQQELAQPMGENEIYPKVPQETLRAEGIGGGGGATAGGAAKVAEGGATGGGEAGDEAVSIIAQQEHGQQIQAGVAKAQAEIAAKRQEHSTKVEEEKARSHQEIAQLQSENSAQQAAERSKAQAEVQQQRSAWQKEQDVLITKSRKDADEAVSKGNKDVQQEQTQAESQAAEHIQKGEEEAAVARQKGEQDAEKERQKGEEESGGILGWLADKAKAFFDGIKQAIQKAFEVARAAVKAAIEGAQKLATAVIETARQAIVGIIKAVGAALIAIGDVLLAAFPEIRDRFRNAIKGVVKAAETAVNALADTLKKSVQAALNLLGKGLDAALGLLEKGMMAAVDIAKTAVQGAIKLADAAIKAVGAFAVLVKDVAANPSQWLSNLGAGANDGIKNHFWAAFQTAVKEWFSQKVEEVLGLGMTVWNVLKQGGINTAEVGKMAWEGIKSAIPAVLIGLLIEKVVSMIVPAAGTVLLIIEGLQAAWGTVSRILQAFERFMAFLKAVKTGQAGPPFGAALAAAGVVVIDFVSNWLLKRLRGPASKVAGKIKEIAKKIGNKVKNVAKKLGKKFGKLKDKFFGKKRGKGNKDKKAAETNHKDKKKDSRTTAQKSQDLQKAVEEVKALTRNKLIRGPILKIALLRIKSKYKLTILKATKVGRASEFKTYAKINPDITFEIAFVHEDASRIAKAALPRINALNDKSLEKIKQIVEQVKNQQVNPGYLLEWGTPGEHKQTPVYLVFDKDKGNKALIGEIWQEKPYIEKNKLGGHPSQKLFEYKADKKEYVLDKKGQYVVRYLYRNIAAKDVETLADKRKNHIEPTGSRSRVTPLEHVMGHKPSPYTSATKTKGGQIENPSGETFDHYGRVKLDLLYIDPQNILDVSTKVGQEEWGFRSAGVAPAVLQAIKDVERTQEVLIKGIIPRDAIEDLRTKE
ncbi:eCIS core domain-containing protein [Allocoleopsis franciscana]|uniref:eCIS core domain-containing protein n=1 Tax=Allocoleopsis franciscana PCC 7113 TaxID=1173027 RepID=K9WP64_9CYAN|nr:DUF4157 domain-containing protein [Allocoleopsis franciscana]AFZ21581.1 hypothetical protein Mic7113_5979 [Allocoleopsis franciscana PCC 7113]